MESLNYSYKASGSCKRSRHFQSFISYQLFTIWLAAINVQHASATIQSPPVMVKQPPATEILFQVAQREDESDRPFLIECEANGSPPPTYHWTKNGKGFNWTKSEDRISQQSGQGTLFIKSPRDEDIGQYQCYAKNEWGTATSNSVFVRKAELNSFKEDNTSMITAQEGKPFKLPCNSPDGYPKPKVYWVLQNTAGAFKSINSSRITVDPEGHLWFSNVTRQDRSVDFNYACVAFSPFRAEYKVGSRVYLRVAPPSDSTSDNKHAPVLQYTTKRNTVALKGDEVEIWCIVSGTPLPEIKWSKKGGMMATDRVQYHNDGKTLRIRDVSFNDEGTYDCDATNGVGAPVSHSVQLKVLAAPYFTDEPDIQNAAEGEKVEFHCEAEGKPSPEIKWIVNGVPLEKAPANPRRRMLSLNTIRIENLRKEDTGNYGCNATNSWGYVYKDVYVLALPLPAEIAEPPKDAATVDGATVTLHCRVFGAPKPLVRWIRDGEELTGGRYRLMDNGDLQITSVSFVDAGTYTCLAQNKFGSDNKTGSLAVKEHTRIQDVPEDSEVATENTVTFRCSAVSDPSLLLDIEWLRDGVAIDFEAEQRYTKLQDNSLTIDKATELDTGIYTCRARTELDSASANATLVVLDRPNPPQLIQAECSRTHATISWKAMSPNGSPILHYTIQFNTAFTPDTWEDAHKDVPATENSFTVGMKPYANYTFRVIARNKIGPSKPSDHRPNPPCETPKDVPQKNPMNVKGHGNRPDNLVISWTPMPEIEHAGPRFRYVVQWKPDDGSQGNWNREEIKDWRQSELTVPNTPTYRPYVIRVKALNEVGESSVAPEEVIGYSGQDKPLEAPQNFTLLRTLDYEAVHVSWNPVPPESLRGKFEGYKVQYWTDDDVIRDWLVPPEMNETVLDTLAPFSRNFLRVFAYNTDYNGPPSETIVVMTEEGPPGPVQNFDAYPLGTSAFYLSWRKPEKPNGILIGYEIYYQEVLHNNNPNRLREKLHRYPDITDPKIHFAKLAGLKPDTKYRIHIHAKTSRGEGEGYYIEERTGSEDEVAGGVAKPSFHWTREQTTNNGTTSNIRVYWRPNVESQARPGAHFYVQYKVYGETQWKTEEPEMWEDYYDVWSLSPGAIYVLRVVSVDGKQEAVSDAQEIRMYPSGILSGIMRMMLLVSSRVRGSD